MTGASISSAMSIAPSSKPESKKPNCSSVNPGTAVGMSAIFGGAFGLGLAFGFQKVAANYISGFLLLSDESIRVGDMIDISGEYGRVTAIKSRYTAVKRLDGVEVLIPNEQLLTSEITNLTFSRSNPSC